MNWREVLPYLYTAAGVLGGAAFLLWGFISGFRKRARIAKAALDKAHDDLIEVMKLQIDSWKNRFAAEHSEFAEYRKTQHDHNNAANERVIKLTAENVELRAKTDLSPVLQFTKDQTTINAKVVQSLDAILLHLAETNGTARAKRAAAH
jgi:hypothetical protein